jgi:hypothetical protein
MIKHRYLKQDWYCVGFDFLQLPLLEWTSMIDRFEWCKTNLGPRGKRWRQQFLTPSKRNQTALLQNDINPFLSCFFMFSNENDAILFVMVFE